MPDCKETLAVCLHLLAWVFACKDDTKFSNQREANSLAVKETQSGLHTSECFYVLVLDKKLASGTSWSAG